MKFIGVVLLYSSLLPIAWADCVKLKSQELVGTKTEQHSNTVEWQADLENTCEGYVYVGIDVQLLDNEGESIYELKGVESFDSNESKSVGKEVYVRKEIAQKTKSLSINIEERSKL